MTIDVLPSYETGRLDRPAMPPRSRLYPLEPIGVGRAEVESLTSYLTRLAYAHGVTLGKLAAEEFAPLIDKSGETALSKFTYRTQNLNGMGVWTQMTLNALETLTCRNDLRFLTMYP